MNSPILVFDLGDVLYQVDYKKSLNQFGTLAGKPLEFDPDELFFRDIFKNFETGAISEKSFRKEIRMILGSESLDDEIDAAWNAMLVGVKNRRMADLLKLKKEYPLFLLSNTNPIHMRKLETECPGLFSIFDKCMYSFEMALRKPMIEIYEKAADLGGYAIKNSWMIDDRAENIEGAKLAGMMALQIKNDEDWKGLMKLLAPVPMNNY